MSSRRVRFGWNADGSPNNEQQTTIDLIADQWLERYRSATRVAAELNERGVPTARGKAWRDTSVRKVIADNPERVAAAEERHMAAKAPAKKSLSIFDDDEPYWITYQVRDRSTGRMKWRDELVEPPPPMTPEQIASQEAQWEEWNKRGDLKYAPSNVDSADWADRDRWLSGKTMRVPGPRLPGGGYPRGYWPMPAWVFFEQARKTAALPCMCRPASIHEEKPQPEGKARPVALAQPLRPMRKDLQRRPRQLTVSTRK